MRVQDFDKKFDDDEQDIEEPDLSTVNLFIKTWLAEKLETCHQMKLS